MENKRKECAINAMRKLGIYGRYINKFKSRAQTKCVFYNFGGFYISDKELLDEIEKFEREYDATVYAVTEEVFNGEHLFDLLYVTDEDAQGETNAVEYCGNGTFSVIAHTINKTYPSCSESGYIGIRSFGGGIKRVS